MYHNFWSRWRVFDPGIRWHVATPCDRVIAVPWEVFPALLPHDMHLMFLNFNPFLQVWIFVVEFDVNSYDDQEMYPG
jgi:hypothetical protein